MVKLKELAGGLLLLGDRLHHSRCDEELHSTPLVLYILLLLLVLFFFPFIFCPFELSLCQLVGFTFPSLILSPILLVVEISKCVYSAKLSPGLNHNSF